MAKAAGSDTAWSRTQRGLGRGFTYLILILGASVMVLPFLWMVSTSVMTIGEANSGRLLPRPARMTCPHVNLAKYTEGTVTDFAVSPEVREGEQELPTDGYYVEVRQGGEEEAEESSSAVSVMDALDSVGSGTAGTEAAATDTPDTGEGATSSDQDAATGKFSDTDWLFRLVNAKIEPIAIVPADQPQGALTEDWQLIPSGGGTVDTGRGLSFTFAAPGAYEEAGRRSGAARIEYVNCCEYPTDVLVRNNAERGEREYTGRPIPEDLSECRTPARKAGYFFFEFIGGNYYQAWTTANFREYVWNSIRLTAITLAGILVVSTLAAYAFGRMQFPGRNFLFVLLLSTMMIPETVVMIPNFLTISGNNPFLPFINWYDNWPALTIPFMAGFFNIFLLRQFFAQIPDELWDAARIDGAGHLRFLIQVVLPLSKAPIMTVVIFAFIGSWNALLWPLIATKAGSNWWPISVGLQNFVTEAGPETHLWMAGAAIAMLPVLLLYFLAQRQFIEGIATTGLKG